MNNHLNLLKQKIEDLPFSPRLKTILAAQNLLTLQHLLQIEVYNWHKTIPGFTYHHQQEILNFLQENNLTDHLKED
jgi:hypothetical protein